MAQGALVFLCSPRPEASNFVMLDPSNLQCISLYKMGPGGDNRGVAAWHFGFMQWAENRIPMALHQQAVYYDVQVRKWWLLLQRNCRWQIYLFLTIQQQFSSKILHMEISPLYARVLFLFISWSQSIITANLITFTCLLSSASLPSSHQIRCIHLVSLANPTTVFWTVSRYMRSLRKIALLKYMVLLKQHF